MGDGQSQACRVNRPQGSPVYFNHGHPWAAFKLMPMASVSLPFMETLEAITIHACRFQLMTPVYIVLCMAVICKKAGQEADICTARNACVTQFDVLTDSQTYHAARNDTAKPQRPNDKCCSIHFASHMGVLRHQDDSCHVED